MGMWFWVLEIRLEVTELLELTSLEIRSNGTNFGLAVTGNKII